ncbi:unnamed protein product [Fusarium graminearum]|nr:unnamed protein product [Fusarium graminearum]CAG2001227.1 unnamed protein product [Fusarium graminearum]VTO93470.1 unnamed protein product [Fusarium graminearum]
MILRRWKKTKRGGVNCDKDEIEDEDETLKTRMLPKTKELKEEHEGSLRFEWTGKQTPWLRREL